MAAPIAPLPSVSASNNCGVSSSLCLTEQVAKFWARFRTFRDLRRGRYVTRWSAFLQDPGDPTQRSETGRWAAARSGQLQETAHPTAARRDHGSASKLYSPATTADQLPVSIRFVKRPPLGDGTLLYPVRHAPKPWLPGTRLSRRKWLRFRAPPDTVDCI